VPDAWQPLLDFGADPGTGPFRVWPADARRELSDGAWIDSVPGWIPDPDDLFETLIRDVPWRAEETHMYESKVIVPRLLGWYENAGEVPHSLVGQCRDELNERYCGDNEDALVSAGLCLYRDGRDSVAWHGDRRGRGRYEDTVVAVLSLGSARTFLLRPRGGGKALRFTVGHGDLLVMGGTCQRTWDHAVPKTRALVGPRISVQFRPSGIA
jgi:alkylated DNA repair dioxygenase AlkB